MNDDLLGNVGLILGAASFYTHNVVNGYTMARPGRSKFEAWVVSMVVGSIIALAASVAAGLLFSAYQMAAQIALAALLTGSAAAGSALTQTSAQAAQQAAKPQATEPDPVTPSPTQRESDPIRLPTAPGAATLLDFERNSRTRPARRARETALGGASRAAAQGGSHPTLRQGDG